ncbi:MAG: replicative DNA helicase [Bacteroidetes bacterium]|nr:replicative DNA helicase [Bacteroidota bacterium]
MQERKQYDSKTRKNYTKSFSLPEGAKLPPQALELEEAVLGALMLEKHAITLVAEILSAASFYKEAHAMIFQAIADLFGRAEPIDILTVSSELKKKGQLEIVGGAYAITMLTNRVTSAANIEYHARIIAEKHLQREMIRISGEIQTEAYEDSADAFDLLDSAEKKLFELSQGNIKRAYMSMNAVVKQTLKDIEDMKLKTGKYTGIPSGFTKLDRITSGFQRSDLIIVAARPGMGKTAFALSVARNASFEGLGKDEKPRGVAIFSLEMGNKQMVSRMISSEAEISGHKLRTGELRDFEWEMLNTRIAKLSEAPIFIDDTPALSVFELRAKCRRLKQQNDICMILIDYLQLMRGDDASNKNGNREQEVSYISRSLKALAKELDVPVIALSQLSRQTERRSNSNRPMLSDLRESGSIEQDADMVMFIYRPEYYQLQEWEDGTSTSGQAEVMIAKNRHGALENIRLRFLNDYTKFTDLTEDSYEYQNDFPPGAGLDSPGVITKSSRMNDYQEDEDNLGPAPF